MKLGNYSLDIFGIVMSAIFIIIALSLFGIFIGKFKKAKNYLCLGGAILSLLVGVYVESMSCINASKEYDYSTQLYSCQEHNDTVFVVEEYQHYYYFKIKDENNDKEFRKLKVIKKYATIDYSGVSNGRLEAHKEPWKAPTIEIVLPHETLYI